MKKSSFLPIAFVVAFIVACGSGGGSSSDGGSDSPDAPVSRIKNPILENPSPLGISTFAIGVDGKFPIEDAQQTPEGLGVTTVVGVVRNVATNELFDFPEHPGTRDQVKAHLKKLVDTGHIVTHEIHVLNGPGMRKDGDWKVNAVFGYNVSDETFVKELPRNPAAQNGVRAIFNDAVAYARQLEALGVQVLICPELEDNHDAATERDRSGNLTSYGWLISFLTDAGWARESIVRNGLGGGHIHAIPNIRYEVHHGSPNTALTGLQAGDIFNMDGVSFTFGDEASKSCLYTEDQVRQLRDNALNKGVIFFIWHSELQGLYYNGCSYAAIPSRDNRNYNLKKPIRQASILLGIPPEQVIVE